jgi:hypothetical protein
MDHIAVARELLEVAREIVTADDPNYALSQSMNKTKSLIDKVYRKAMSYQNAEAVDAIEKAQEPFFKMARDSGWVWMRYSDPWKDVSEQDKKKLIDIVGKTLKAVKEIAKDYGLV